MSSPINARAHWRVLAVGAVVMLALSGCWRPRPRPTDNTFEGRAKQVQRTAPDTRPWFCNATGVGAPPHGHGNGAHVHPYYQGKVKGPLSWPDCLKLAAELDQTMRAVKGLETKAKGEAAGWRQAAPYIAGLGTHHVKFGGGGTTPGSSMPGTDEIQRIVTCLREQGVNLTGFPNLQDPAVIAAFRACNVPIPEGGLMNPGAVNQPFDPSKPQILIYGGDDAEAPLVGVGYMFAGSDTPPAAYTGGNDWWHLHSKICAGVDPRQIAHIDTEEITEEQCRAAGGTLRELFPGRDGQAGGIWLLHMWMIEPYEYRPDLFVSGHPCLGATRVMPQSDPCWVDARRDPARGPVPTTPTTHPTHPTHPTSTTRPAPTTGAPTTAAPTTAAPTTAAPTTAAPTTPTTHGHGDHGH